MALRSAIRQRALRLLAGAILSSDLTNADIKQFAEELEGGNIHNELAYLLLRLSADHFASVNDSYVSSQSNLSSLIYRKVRNRKIPRDVLQDLLNSFGSEKNIFPDKDAYLSIREMVDAFVKKSTERQVSKLLEHFDQVDAGDPYLKGILRRGES